MSTVPIIATAIGTGVPGLDEVLGGGFTPDRLYLVEGVPGSGKTTLALQFLLEGVRKGERVLYVTLSESLAEVTEAAASHGWSLDGIEVFEALEGADNLSPDAQYTMFHPAEVELGDTTKRILDRVDALRPQRVVLDSLAELRLLSGSPLRYRRQVLALKQYFGGLSCTTLLLDDSGAVEHGLHVHTIVHGVIGLSRTDSEYGGDRRRLRVSKFRGRRFVGGYHDYQIETGGLRIYPRLVASDHRGDRALETVSTDSAELDALLGGGVDRGTSTLLVGAAGTGKSTLATHIVMAAVARGEHAAIFTFDESIRSLVKRSEGLGMDISSHMQSGLLHVQAINASELSPGEFIQRIRDAVERDSARVIVIDSLNGYLHAMPGEQHLLVQLHELLAYLGSLGVITVMVSAQLGLIGTMTSSVDVSYLADSVVLLRYFELNGEVRQALSVLKKRTGGHERTIRSLSLTPDGGVAIGPVLREYRGVLTGVPQERAVSGGGIAK